LKSSWFIWYTSFTVTSQIATFYNIDNDEDDNDDDYVDDDNNDEDINDHLNRLSPRKSLKSSGFMWDTSFTVTSHITTFYNTDNNDNNDEDSDDYL
jgi:hypothetical protein